MADDRVSQIIFRYSTDRASANSTIQVAESIEKRLDGLENTTRSVTSAAKAFGSASSGLAQRLKGEAAGSVRALASEMDDLRNSIEGVNASSQRLEGLQKIGRLAANVPGLEGVAGGFNIADDAKDAVEGIRSVSGALQSMDGIIGNVARTGAQAAVGLGAQAGGLAAGIGSVLAVAAPAAIAVGLISVAVANFIKQIEGGKAHLDAGLQAQDDYYSAVETMTTEQAQQEIAQRQQHSQILQQQIDETQNALNQIPSVLQGLSPLSGRLDDLRKELDANDQTVNRLTEGVRINAFAQNDLVAAQEAATKAAQEHAQALLAEGQARLGIINQIAQDQAQFASTFRQINEATTTQQLDSIRESTEARINSLTAERNALEANLSAVEAMRDAGQITAAQFDAYRSHVGELDSQIAQLTNSTLTLINGRYDEVRAMEDQANKLKANAQLYDQTTSQLQRAGEELAKTQDQLDKLETDLNTKLVELAQERTDAEVKAALERDKAFRDAELQAREDRIDALNQAHADEIKLEFTHRRKLQEIERQYQSSYEDAVAGRNVDAAYEAEKARDEAVADEKQSYEDSRKDIGEQLKKTNAEINKRLVEQRNLAVARYDEQYQAAQAAYFKQRAAEGQRYRQQQNELQQHLNALQQQEVGYRQRIAALTQQFGSQMVSAFQQLASKSVAAVSAAVSGLGTGKVTASASGVQGPTFAPKFAEGPPMRVTKAGYGWFDPGDVIIPPKNRGVPNGGITFAPTIKGVTRPQIHQEIDRYVDDLLDEVGVN